MGNSTLESICKPPCTRCLHTQAPSVQHSRPANAPRYLSLPLRASRPHADINVKNPINVLACEFVQHAHSRWPRRRRLRSVTVKTLNRWAASYTTRGSCINTCPTWGTKTSAEGKKDECINASFESAPSQAIAHMQVWFGLAQFQIVRFCRKTTGSNHPV